MIERADNTPIMARIGRVVLSILLICAWMLTVTVCSIVIVGSLKLLTDSLAFSVVGLAAFFALAVLQAVIWDGLVSIWRGPVVAKK